MATNIEDIDNAITSLSILYDEHPDAGPTDEAAVDKAARLLNEYRALLAVPEGYELSVSNFEADKMSLVVLTRQDEGEYDHACHLFVYTGEDRPHLALLRAAKEYYQEHADFIHETVDDFDWYALMADFGDYHDVFRKHGLVEVAIPMGLQSIVVRNGDSIEEG